MFSYTQIMVAVAALTILSALLSVAMPLAHAFLPEMAPTDQLSAAFSDAFKMGMGALIGLLGGLRSGGGGSAAS